MNSQQPENSAAANESAVGGGCRVCGSSLATGALDSLCPACLLAGSLMPEGGGADGGATWMTVFPQLKIGSLVAGIPGVETYEAISLADESPVRLSVATSNHITEAGGASLWKHQINALDRLNHPNIARIVDSGDIGRRFFLITACPDGRSLHELVEAGEVSTGKLEALVRQLNDAVASARSVGVNLSCSFSEVVVGPDGQAKLIPGLESAPPDSSNADNSSERGMSAVTPGMQLGHYHIIDKIGEGGFADVWLADQEEPVQRRVALKILKEGMDTRRVLARFEAERQALALLDHPNIARVLDAGATDGGRPFFVMEAVDGDRITDWCKNAASTWVERVELVRAVCSAVQHAHQRGIIHRDLKPSNVLVTSSEGAGAPKVIDFGIAKAIERSLTEQTIFTRDDQVLGTPEYMSPEQAEGDAAAVDSRSDVYALGVLLYELLTGATPIAVQQTKAKNDSAGIAELRRRIREIDPPAPGKLAETSNSETGVQARIPQELDWVVMKALAKEPERRYQSAAEFADDLRRGLAHEAVQAGAPTRSYRVRKFVRRHRAVVFSAAAVVTALAVGVTLAFAGLLEARKERQNALASQRVAESEAEIAETLNAFFRDDLLGRANPYATIDEKDITLREAVDRAAKTVDARFAEKPEVLGAIHQSLANTYKSLSVYDRAEEHGRRAAEIFEELHGFEHTKTIDANSLLASILEDSADAELALALHRRVLAARVKRLGPEDASTLRTRRRIARMLHKQGDYVEGKQQLREVLAVQQRVLGADHPDTRSTVTSLSQALMTQSTPSEHEEAFTMMNAQLKAIEELYGKDSPEVMNVLHSLANMMQIDGRPEEAEPIQRRILDYRTKTFGEEHGETVAAINNLALTLKQQSKLTEALELYRRSLGLDKILYGLEHRTTVLALNNLGTALAKAGQHKEALVQLQQAVDVGSRVKGAEHADTLASRMHLADCHDVLGNKEETLRIYQEIVPLSRQALGPTHPAAILQGNNLAFFLDEAKRYEEAEKVWREVCAAAEERYGKDSPKLADYLGKLGWNLRDQKRWADAMPVVKRCEEIMEKHYGADDRRTMENRVIWLMLDHRVGGTVTKEKDQEFVRLFNAVYDKNITLDDIRAERERQRNKPPPGRDSP